MSSSTIPTEPIGSVPRPLRLIEQVAKGDATDLTLDSLYEEAVRDTVERFEATGSPVITDGDRNAKAQGRLIEDLLDISRIISGNVRIELDPVEPVDFVAMAIEAVRPAANAKDIRLQVNLDTDTGSLTGDRDRLQQVVWNLLTNAVKFTPKGGSVQVRLRRLDSSVEIVIEDNGQGISPAFLPYVFERFRQADASFTRSKGGLGLGLAIVRHLVELHGGTIKAQSAGEGSGSKFTVSLPMVAIRQRVVLPATSDATTTPEMCPPTLDGLRILIVDDEPDAREMLGSMLEHCKATVTIASSAAEALAVLERTRPDVLVSDIGMPREDGYDLIRKVRALGAAEGGRTPAVALTAYARHTDRTQALMAGFDMHVSKPVDASELVVVIANLFARQQRR